MVQELIAKKFLTDKETKQLEGTWIDESYMKFPVVTEDMDVYYWDQGEKSYHEISKRGDVVRVDSIGLGFVQSISQTIEG